MGKIESIEFIKGYRIFKDYKGNLIEDFKERNLIYGWNGSGKTTLSNFFAALEFKKTDIDFNESTWKIKTDTGYVCHTDLEKLNLNIRVFNETFIKRNIDFNGLVKGLLLVAEEKIDEKKEFDAKMKEIQKLDNDKIPKEINTQDKFENELNSFGTKSAKNIKGNFKLIETDDNRFLNYDKRKLEQFITENEAKIKSRTGLLSDDLLDGVAKAVKPQERSSIKELEIITFPDFNKVYDRVVTLLLQTVLTKSIDKLKINPELSKWIEKGLEIHDSKPSKCEFCGNNLSQIRIDELNAHFSKSFQELTSSISRGIDWIKTQKIQIDFPGKELFYDEYKNEYAKLIINFKRDVETFNDVIEEWLVELERKKGNPFYVPDSTISELSNSFVEGISGSIYNINSIIKSHNSKFNDYKNVVAENKFKLELHYVTEAIFSEDYYTKLVKLENSKKNLKDFQDTRELLKLRIDVLEGQLSDELLGGKKFNESLHKFIGRNDITLRFIQEKHAYAIHRNGVEAKNLSEGEQTAIAFIYFITKLVEKANKIEDTIVVIDDPVSSFDSNHLFNAYSYLKSHCEHANQLFVLTHNFTFFKLIRQWFAPNKHDKSYNSNIQDNKDKVRLYSIESKFVNNERESELINADNTLKEFNSEYHYLFKKLHGLKGKELSLDEAYLSANLLRKLLETFLNFKFPKYRNDFRILMQHAVIGTVEKAKEPEAKTREERIYKFINKYSHGLPIDSDDMDIRLSEQKDIIDIVLNEIERLDKEHYCEMLEAISI
ncbi:MAG: AAA family ATPase [Bacteroidales bacterium]